MKTSDEKATMASNKLPDSVRIRRKKYKVVQAEANEKWYGECDSAAQVITIFGEQPNEEACDTIIHECAHMAVEELGIKFKTSLAEEKYVQKFTKIFMELMKKNPQLLKYVERTLHKAK